MTRDESMGFGGRGKAALEVARAWMDAAARGDLTAVAAGMADGCRRFGEASWMAIGKDAYIAAYARFAESFSDYRLDVVNVMARDRTIVFEMIESATFSGPYLLPDGRVIPPNGQSYTDRVCTWLELDEDGKIAEIRAYIPTNRTRLLADAAEAASAV